MTELLQVASGVTVCWHDAASEADDALRAHVGTVLGLDPGSVDVGRLCGSCGSSEHGRPWAGHGVEVSLARSGPHLVTAVSTAGRVGVDVESVARVHAATESLPDLGTSPAQCWCRAEAALKREGTGLSTPRELTSAAAADHVLDLEAPPGHRAAVAVTVG
jgi:4'-phosphopantetheinyl transferase